jgi:glyceraldehyde 3-phosphate dehydrogenase
MSPLKIAINGFGRIGRLVLRAAMHYPDGIEVVGINDLYDPKTLAYLLKYDSVHGPFMGSCYADDEGLVINGRLVPCSDRRDPANLPWSELGVDYVVESTGLFTTYDSAKKHIDAGARRVIISAPTKDDPDRVPTFVMGVNQQDFDPQKHQVVSNASCTTNCLAPIAKVMHDRFGIAEGLMTTVHATTSTQATVDSPNSKDLRSGRAAAMNIIPASTGAAKAVTLVLPELKGRLTGMAFRVPTPNVSVVDLTLRTEQATSYEDICATMRDAADTSMRGILAYTTDPVVSTDFQGNPHSSIFDAGAGIELNDRFFKLIAWYDNEWGYSNRLIDLMLTMAAKEAQTQAIA